MFQFYFASFRCKLHCPCRITRETTFLSSPLDVLPADVVSTENSKSQAPINQGSSKRQYLNRRPISGQPSVDRKFQIRSSNNHCLVMSATVNPSCSELSEALQRNAKPRKRGDFRHPKDGLYAAKHEARLSNISDLCSFAAFENKSRSFARAQDDKACRSIWTLVFRV